MHFSANSLKIIKFKKLLLLLFFLQLLLPARVVEADTGPKPTMEFEFHEAAATEPVTIMSGILYECEQPDCSDARPLERLGPQGFDCSTDRCDALAYGFAPHHRIEIEFSDGRTKQSNIFQTAGFESRYKVTVNPNDLLVEAQFSPPAPQWMMGVLLLCACVLCGGVLLIIMIVFVIWRFSRK